MTTAAAFGPLPGSKPASEFIEAISKEYEQAHKEFEDNFWATKMGLAGASTDALAATKTRLDEWLADPSHLAAVKEQLADLGLSPEQRQALAILEKAFRTYAGGAGDPRVAELQAKLNELEAELASHRNGMALGWRDPSDPAVLHKASSVQLRMLMRTSPEEPKRLAAYEGLRSVGPHVVERFCEIVKLRNRLARLAGPYEDYFDMKVTQAEGMSKARLFEILDGLEKRTRPLAEAARAALAGVKGEGALAAHNMGYALSGDVEAKLDPYFPFEDAVDVWARTFAALGISYRGAVMRLDLCDREGKYSNGFCHWPQPAWVRADGTWVPSQANFTSLATPSAVGSGKTALGTLLHEGGHAAHFANITQRTPLASQERAPTSVAYAENQSMFLDSLAGDAAWLARYARSRGGEVMPWGLVEEQLKATQPYEVFQVRSMLSVPYFEKALYELPEAEVTPARVLALADETEARVEGGPAPRPLMSVPHILADESSAYYQGYILAEMSVHQTRHHFLHKYGAIVDDSRVGADLTEHFWKPGNGSAFLDLVEQLTGAPLTADAWVQELRMPLQTKLEEERRAYDAAVKAGPKYQSGQEVDLGMQVILVHGDEVLADSAADGSLAAACAKFKGWVRAHYFGDGEGGAGAGPG